MLAIDFIAAQYGSVLKGAGAHTGLKAEGIAPNGTSGVTITVLKNQDGDDVLAKYTDGEALFAPNFIRADNQTDFYFSEITISDPACIILNKG